MRISVKRSIKELNATMCDAINVRRNSLTSFYDGNDIVFAHPRKSSIKADRRSMCFDYQAGTIVQHPVSIYAMPGRAYNAPPR